VLYALEAQAKAAGGAVYVMLGNHESLELGGEERDLNPRYVAVRRALNAPTYASLWGPDSLLGQWLRTKAAVMKIGDFLWEMQGLLVKGGVIYRARIDGTTEISRSPRSPGG
jgi:hypothetical protein